MLAGKTALVTGASKEIGRALAVGLAAQGASVAVNFKNDEVGARETCAAIEQAGGTALLAGGDIGDREATRAVVEKVVDRLGRLDILVNNAARTRFGPAEDVTSADWSDVMTTNLEGPFVASVLAAGYMPDGGAILNVTTCATGLMIPYHAIYTASKGGLESLTQALALEYAPRVRVNAIAPAPTSNARNTGYDPQFDDTWARLIPMGRVAQPYDLVGPAVFLVSDASRFLTGQVLRVDGGWSLRGVVPAMEGWHFKADYERDTAG